MTRFAGEQRWNVIPSVSVESLPSALPSLRFLTAARNDTFGQSVSLYSENVR